ncbi:protein sprouty homolog 1 [Lampris incognitus]|uniref:protein sprouty homolog 1 n=1 Tax=Lampris incognitus TaxID=2546036 RepID=UPI0024B4BBE7|nr:protein sprouty homolog 1 [Lampris incognitus]XP_056138239.1 protein sprouty homolog 1 [Lampris incognitus]
MELQTQHGPGGSLVVIQQPSLEGRQRSDYERELHHAAILSLDQIKVIRSSNEYTEGPSVVRRPPAPRMAPRPQDKQERTHEVILVNVNNNYEHRPSGHHHNHHHHHHNVVVVAPGQQYGGGPRAPGLSRSTSTGSAASSGSNSSASSEQGLLARSPPARPGVTLAPHHHRAERPVQTQPKPKGLSKPTQTHQTDAPLKPPGKGKTDSPGGGGSVAAGGGTAAAGHQFICERCGKCKCGECTAPRSLPSCLACNGQCLCSAESALEHGTCMCLVKGIFYHCSNDDEGDSCADHPCSLSRSHCCPRFLCMGLMSVLFPCLLCYPPVKGCLKACQGCYDRVNRPGCRCKNSNTVYCKLESWAPQTPEKPS